MSDRELELAFLGAHSAPVPDAAQTPQSRSLPRHRARRRAHWKPDLQPVEAQHANHGDTFVR
ncbi:MAG: hypothetical protein ABI566_13145 [Pseudolysinimonas sp.]